MFAFSKLFIGNIGTLGISIFCIIFVWQYTVMINHVYDEKIDAEDNKERLIPKKLLSKKQVKNIAIIYAIIALVLSFSLGVWSFVLVIIGLILGTIYSVKPIRLRDTAFSTMVIGGGSIIAFFIGYVTPAYIQVMHGPSAGEIVYTYPTFTLQALIIGLIIFVALSIGSLAKDYKDFKGDKKAGVKNLFTIYGVEKGIKIVSILLPVTFFILILLFNSLVDIVIFIPLGLIAGFLFYRYKKTEYIFVLYFPVIIYCLLRWFQIIQF
jgi:homogentisate phytyltransferase/homogentisate geranylgeranyltransferase